MMEWKCSRIISVQASSLEVAMLNVKSTPQIEDPNYISGSFVIDEEGSRILNEEF